MLIKLIKLFTGFTTVMSDSLKLILDTMCETGVKAISVCLSCMYQLIVSHESKQLETTYKFSFII